MRKSIFLVILFIVCIQFISFAQEKKTYGLSGTIQGGQYGILVPIWIAEKTVLAPSLEIKYAEKVATDIGIGLVPRFYFNNEKLSPYLGFKFGVIINNNHRDNLTDNESKLDLLGGLALGFEYFVDEHLSIGVEAQGNLTISDKNSYRFGNPDGVNFNTGTMISLTLYR